MKSMQLISHLHSLNGACTHTHSLQVKLMTSIGAKAMILGTRRIREEKRAQQLELSYCKTNIHVLEMVSKYLIVGSRWLNCCMRVQSNDIKCLASRFLCVCLCVCGTSDGGECGAHFSRNLYNAINTSSQNFIVTHCTQFHWKWSTEQSVMVPRM